jgi:hypothetical protein
MAKLVRISVFFLLLMAVFYLVNQAVINSFYLSGKRLACWINPQFAAIGGQDRQVTLDWDTRVHYDVVVAGSSHAYRGYDPRLFRQFGLDLYTIGTGYQNTLASYVLLKNDCTPKPKSLVILDVYDNTFSGDGMGCFSRLIPNAASEQTARDFLRRAFDLRLLNAYFCYLFADQERSETPLKPGYVGNGYSETTDSSQVAVDTAQVEGMMYSFDPTYLHYIQQLDEMLRASDCKLVLASHPMVVSPRSVAFHRAFRDYLDPLLKSQGLTYIDFSEHLDFDPHHHFMDGNHLNQAGVDKYNRLLIDSLQKLHFLPQQDSSAMPSMP